MPWNVKRNEAPLIPTRRTRTSVKPVKVTASWQPKSTDRSRALFVHIVVGQGGPLRVNPCLSSEGISPGAGRIDAYQQWSRSPDSRLWKRPVSLGPPSSLFLWVPSIPFFSGWWSVFEYSWRAERRMWERGLSTSCNVVFQFLPSDAYFQTEMSKRL